ncbi:MAG: hypothetical protein HYY67_05445 [Thaumarchaeota archaeon]|nr:hypothetical protein [Nitrososphaerota archaeon]
MSDQKTIGGRIKSLFISEEGIIFTILNMLMITFAVVMVWALSKAG